jgi:hypothetical protein
MVATDRLIRLVQPFAADFLAIDANAIAWVRTNQSAYAGQDHQPAATAAAMQRRSFVATEVRKLIDTKMGWPLNEETLPCGGYEWLPDGVSVRLSKTTPESRLEETKALLGVQSELLSPDEAPLRDDQREIVLIRLMGNPLEKATVDVVSLADNGRHGVAVPMSAIAAANLDRLPSTGTPAKTSVTLPGERRIAESG